MLTDPSGNSQVTQIASTSDNAVADAFGVKREATIPTPVAQVAQPATNVPPQAEGSSPKPAEPSLATPEKAQTPSPDGKILQKKASEDHRLVIDLLEDKFRMLQEGRVEDKELRQWFDEHPDIADKANKSKRVKDRFRSLMERDEAARYDDDIKARRATQTRDDEEIDDEDKSLKKSLDGKSLNETDMEKFLAKFEERMEQRAVTRERDEELKTFAVNRKIVDDDFKRLATVTSALGTALPEWPHTQTLEAAYRALFPGKGEQIVVPGGAVAPAGSEPQRLDLSQPTALFSKEEFFGAKRK